MLDFILGFGKIFLFIILGLIGVIVSAFVYFKVFNKDQNLGFQDFIIDKMSGKRPAEKSIFVQPVPSEPMIPVQKPEKPQLDVLADIAPSSQAADIAKTDIPEHFTEPAIGIPLSSSEPTIPDWLKESTSLGSQSETESTVPPFESAPPEENELPSFTGDEVQGSIIPESESSTSGLPDWLHGTGMDMTSSQDIPAESPIEETSSGEIAIEEQGTPDSKKASDENMSDLPAWMQ